MGQNLIGVDTWGQHTGSNSYAHCTHLFALGVTRRHHLDIASAIAGQTADLNTRFAADLEEVAQVELSEMFHNLMQFAGRGSCRRTVDGKAGAMQMMVLCNDTFSAEVWQAAMPGVHVRAARSKHDTKRGRATVTQEALQKAFEKVNPADDYIASRTLKLLAGLERMDADKFSRVLAKLRKDGAEGWTYQKSRQGFVRDSGCPFA